MVAWVAENEGSNCEETLGVPGKDFLGEENFLSSDVYVCIHKSQSDGPTLAIQYGYLHIIFN